MNASDIDRLLTALSGSLDAGIAAQEETAAWDLAAALRNDIGLGSALGRGSWAAVVEDSIFPISEVALDFVVAGPYVVPFGWISAVAASDERRAIRSQELLVARLRRVLRTHKGVRIVGVAGGAAGRLTTVGPDYVLVATPSGAQLVGLAAVSAIRLYPVD